ESRQINGTVVEAIVDLISELRDCVNEVFGPLNRRSDSRLVQSRTTSLALFLIQNTNLVERYVRKFSVTKLKPGFFAVAMFLGSARVSRAGFGVAPKRSLFECRPLEARLSLKSPRSRGRHRQHARS